MCLQCSQYHCSLSRKSREAQRQQQTGQFRELLHGPTCCWGREAGDGGREGMLSIRKREAPEHQSLIRDIKAEKDGVWE